MTTAHDDEAAIRRITDVWNAQDLEAFVAHYADPCLYHFGRKDVTLSRAKHLDSAQHYFDVFPDLTATIRTLMSVDDRVYVRWTYVGTHLGTSRSGVEPTGKRVEFGTLMAENRFERGLIVEVWEMGSYIDLEDIA